MRWIYLLFFLCFTSLTFANERSPVEEFKGSVVSVQKYSYVNKPTPQVQFILRTQSGDYTIELGPEWYIHAKGFHIEPMDEVEIMGSIVIVNETKIVLAHQIKKGEHSLKLRDAKGLPTWKGLRKG